MGGAFRCGFGFPSFDRSLDRSLECFVVDTLDALDTQCLSREGPRKHSHNNSAGVDSTCALKTHTGVVVAHEVTGRSI